MWQAVRRELARLEWDVEPPLTLDLMADWQVFRECPSSALGQVGWL